MTVVASINLTAFDCPHCGALAKQQWHSASAMPMKKDGVPLVVNADTISTYKFSSNEEQAKTMREFLSKMETGKPFFEREENYDNLALNNISIAQCFNCDMLSIWLSDKMLWPQHLPVPPNSDLPPDIRDDYIEAGAIAQRSPRGAAALLRLCIQKLCKHLGQSGENLNADIATMTKSGLDPRIQKSLDIVRVIGNSAVHPGQLDLRDDLATVENLFRLLNLIAEVTITYPNTSMSFTGLFQNRHSRRSRSEIERIRVAIAIKAFRSRASRRRPKQGSFSASTAARSATTLTRRDSAASWPKSLCPALS